MAIVTINKNNQWERGKSFKVFQVKFQQNCFGINLPFYETMSFKWLVIHELCGIVWMSKRICEYCDVIWITSAITYFCFSFPGTNKDSV